MDELRKAVRAFKLGIASGPYRHPVEYWSAVLESSKCIERANWLLRLCNMARSRHEVPQAWHLAQVTTIYKKGDPGDCGNYRPICLLNAACKVFSMVLLRRLQAAGAGERVSSTQFGFRTERSTEDALHCVRRAVEKTWAHQGGQLHLLALDWRKAFDSIDPDALLNALRRFGLPLHFREFVAGIYSNRSFVVSESGHTSATRAQNSGICQGCPLSPFLFIMVMTVIMHDSISALGRAPSDAYRDGSLYDVLYADDTLILGSCARNVEALATSVEKVGGTYGMTLHWAKTQALSVCTTDKVLRPDGTVIQESGALQYLGATIYGDGRADSELSRKLGAARADFQQLHKLWSRANVARKDKV